MLGGGGGEGGASIQQNHAHLSHDSACLFRRISSYRIRLLPSLSRAAQVRSRKEQADARFCMHATTNAPTQAVRQLKICIGKKMFSLAQAVVDFSRNCTPWTCPNRFETRRRVHFLWLLPLAKAPKRRKESCPLPPKNL